MSIKPYSRDEALRLAASLQKWRQNSAHSAADQLRAAVVEIDRLQAQSDLRGTTVADLAHQLGTVKAVRDQLRHEVTRLKAGT